MGNGSGNFSAFPLHWIVIVKTVLEQMSSISKLQRQFMGILFMLLMFAIWLSYFGKKQFKWEDSQVGSSRSTCLSFNYCRSIWCRSTTTWWCHSVIDPDCESNSCYGLLAIGFDSTHELQVTNLK